MSNPKIKYIIFIECGSTMASPINTGIQRVVRNIVNESAAVTNSMNADFCLVKYNGNAFVEIEHAKFQQPSVIKSSLYLFKIILARIISKRIISIFKRLHSQIKTRKKDIYHTLAARQHKLNEAIPNTKYLPVLLLLDATWDTRMLEAIDKFRNHGGYVSTVLYDLIPFTHPETVAEQTRIAHTSWWSEVPSHVDSIMCISQAVRDEYLHWQQRTILTKALQPENVGYFHLGAEFMQNDPVIKLLSSNTPTYLVVGSLEPRKNHAYILDAFEQLWEQGYGINLAIVGAYGWKSKELINRIESHPQFGNKLLLIRDATDRDLTSLYDKCAALVIASIAEGFGLPIIEASQRGAKIICSDIPVFREVAGEQAVYFDLKNSSSLAEKVLANFESLPKTCPPPKDTTIKSLTWKESTFQLFDGLITLQKKQNG